jgi:ribosomal protein S18 acetylase RimI-like enzyme
MNLALRTAPAPTLAIRRAGAADAPAIARLFLVSSDGLAAYIWSKLALPGQSPAEVGAARYARTGTAFSFENCLLATLGGAVAGMAHAFPMPSRAPDEVEEGPVLAPYAELEEPGSLYLSGLAVDERLRGRGIGGALMDRVERQSRETGCSGVSLICFEANRRAMRFYRERGYREIARRPLVPHPALRYASGDAVLLVRPGRAAGAVEGPTP